MDWFFVARMDLDLSLNADNREQLQVEETDDSCRVDFIEIVPVARDTDGSCTTECVSGDWLDEVKQENLTVVKQEPDDVYWIILVITSAEEGGYVFGSVCLSVCLFVCLSVGLLANL